MTGRRVFITGGAAGLGRAMAVRLAGEGCRVCIGDVDAEAGQKVADEIGGQFRQCDVRDAADLQAAADWMAKAWGGADLLINNAGVAQMGRLSDTSLDDWDWALDINVKGPVRAARAFQPLLADSGGTILNIASMASFLHLPGAGTYNATKAAVLALSETWMLELAQDNIAVHVACPSFFRTDLARNMRAGNAAARAMTTRLVERSRTGPDEVAAAILDGMARGEKRILIDKRARQALRMKNWLPFPRYLKGLGKQAAALETRLARKTTGGDT